MSARPPKRPCTLPEIQIDTWRTAERLRPACSPTKLAQALCGDRAPLLAHALLQRQDATTVAELARAIDYAHEPLRIEINCGQLYMHSRWRVRYGDMDTELQEMVLSNPKGLQQAVEQIYTPQQIEQLIYTAVGPARAMGIRALRQAGPQTFGRQ